jgi:cob(I)alamin adenosyltransferase
MLDSDAVEHGIVANVTTRAGDGGYTGLLGSERVAKYDARIEALGLVDEATSALGLARASADDERVREVILQQQKNLYRLMAELATNPEAAGRIAVPPMGPEDILNLERLSAELKGEVEIGNHFIIPGETFPGAAIDLARTIVRRAERHVARMTHEGAVSNPEALRYLNRLSDLLFILARYLERGRTREVS